MYVSNTALSVVNSCWLTSANESSTVLYSTALYCEIIIALFFICFRKQRWYEELSSTPCFVVVYLYLWQISGGFFCFVFFRMTVLESGSLRISSAMKSDAGLYTCVARNQFGVASSSGTLMVKGWMHFNDYKYHL